jgi:1-deoxy-D-xylulose-5-phosphate synthase
VILEKIQKPNDIQEIPLDEFPRLAGEIRTFLINHISRTGGHLASNLGAVELTMALHNVFHLPEDKIIWDVGHQAYTHKILTGRKEEFLRLRQMGGISGFPKRSESPCDPFDTGHSSTSISAGLGYVRARDLLKQSYYVVSVIGDGALTGGMAYEAMNNAAELKKNFIIVLNDNKMSISPNVGGISSYLSSLRTAESYCGLKLSVRKNLKKIPRIGEPMVEAVHKTKTGIKQLVIPGMLFENMGLTYLGPVNGHNMRQMMKLFNEAKRVEGPVIVHVLTEKGRGYEPAMRHPAKFHGTAPFEIATGAPKSRQEKATYTDVFSAALCKLGGQDPRIAAVTAAMPTGTGLNRFASLYPRRFFDVGIAEPHAVTFAAGLALGGLIPVVAVYSSFLQRAFDQILHDVCMQDLHVVFAIDRAGLVGSDGETHHGCFDFSYLSLMPNMTVMAPKNKWELTDMLRSAVEHTGPVAVRYPRGEAADDLEEYRKPVALGKSEWIFRGKGLAFLAIGSMVAEGDKVRRVLQEDGWEPSLVNMRFVKPLDTDCLDKLAEDHQIFVTLEENVASGGLGEKVRAYVGVRYPQIQVVCISIPDQFVGHGSVGQLKEMLHLDVEGIVSTVREKVSR